MMGIVPYEEGTSESLLSLSLSPHPAKWSHSEKASQAENPH